MFISKKKNKQVLQVFQKISSVSIILKTWAKVSENTSKEVHL